MSEQEQPHTSPENYDQQPERTIDVTSLKIVNMTLDDYNRYADMYPDDPELMEWHDHHDITPGESVIISATDTERPDSNILRVIATGEDSFTTDRSLTNALEKHLAEDAGDTERAIPTEDGERLDDPSLGDVDSEEAIVTDDLESPEIVLKEAQRAFEAKLNGLSNEYAAASNHFKNEIKMNASDITAARQQLEEVTGTAISVLRSGWNQPDSIRLVVAKATEQLSTASHLISKMTESIEDGRVATGSLAGGVESHKSDIGQLRAGLRISLDQIAGGAPELDDATLGKVDVVATESSLRQVAQVEATKEAALEVNAALGLAEEDMGAAQQRIQNLVIRLEEMGVNASYGRLSESEYQGVLQSAASLLNELQEGVAIKRVAALAEGL